MDAAQPAGKLINLCYCRKKRKAAAIERCSGFFYAKPKEFPDRYLTIFSAFFHQFAFSCNLGSDTSLSSLPFNSINLDTMKYLPYTLLLFSVFSAGNVAAETLSLSCPAEIMTDQQVKATPAGWEASVDSSALSPQQGHRLYSVSFYSGAPKDEAMLAPDQTKMQGKKFTSSWELRSAEKKHWFACSYHQTTLILSKQLPDQPMRCEARYSGTSLVPEKLTCRTREDHTRR